jgi:hypothetical protein
MSVPVFDITAADAQGVTVDPLPLKDFDVEAYADYAQALDQRCADFWNSRRGLLVCRRFRVSDVFSSACNDMELSLSLQLSALRASMAYPMDVPNFLEPWYGIGTVAAAYGGSYVWNEGQAPAVEPLFPTIEDAVKHEPRPIEETEIGRKILGMIEYFLDKTRGRLPISFSDIQSPLNAASSLVDTNEFFMAVLDRPDLVGILLDQVTDLSTAFYKKQLDLIGGLLVSPGHGFSSSRSFSGIGASDDSSTMLSPAQYGELVAPRMERLGKAFGGIAYHSCGNWGAKIEAVKGMTGLLMADGAFTVQTDPSPNPPDEFRKQFSDSGICLNARMVGDPDSVFDSFQKLYDPAMKLILVTYCRTPEEQTWLYERVRAEAL